MRFRHSVLTALIVGALAAGCGDSTGSSTPSTSIDTVVMIGDSITVASKPALQVAFEDLDFTTVVIESQNSKRSTVGSGSNVSGLAIATRLAQDDPDHSDELWVIALGTNDIGQYPDRTRITEEFGKLIEAVPAGVPLVWVDTYFRDRPDGAADVNAVIETQIAERGNAVVARWSSVAADEGNLRTDGVHPGDQGTVVFASTVSDAIAELLGRR